MRWWRAVPLAGVVAGCAAAVGAACWYGCSLYDASLLLPAPKDSGGDARDSGAPEASAGPCPELFPPPRPAMDDPSDASDQGFIMALHTVNVGLGDAGLAGLSYDLDQVYTGCDGGPESCKAAVIGATHPDGLGGRDDSAGQLIVALAAFDPAFTTATINERLQQGLYSLLLQVLHYNGQPNDTQVDVGIYASFGVEGDAGARWNGQDSWTVDRNFVASGDAQSIVPNHIDGNAFVSGGVVVMHINFPINLGTIGSSVTTQLTAAVATGTLVASSNGGYRVGDGQMAGRWNVSDLLTSIQNVYVGTTPLCRGSSLYSLVQGEACQYADIMTDPTQDLMGKTCDALSLGIGFTADPALMGSVVTPSQAAPPCEAGVGAEPDNCGP